MNLMKTVLNIRNSEPNTWGIGYYPTTDGDGRGGGILCIKQR